LSVPCARFSSARSCGYCHQDLKITPTVRKLNIVDIVLQLSLWSVSIEVTVTAALNAVRDVDVKGERHIRIVCEVL
jgi:predicted ATPase